MSTAEALRARTVAELGEEGLLALIAPRLPHAPGELVGSGDDCAVLSQPDARAVVSTDVLVEGHHFRTAWSTGRDVGRRAAAQNLADAAAMGARPTALVVGLVLPMTTRAGWVEDLASGLAEGCAPCGAGVVGGDLSAGESLVIAVTVLGDLEGRAPVLRSGARPGDAVVHAGTLGRSAAGLALLSAGAAAQGAARALSPVGRQCVEVFRAPRPPLAAGPALAACGAGAMMDVSDSLLRDAGRIARASGVVIDLEEPGRGALAGDLEALEPVAAELAGLPAVPPEPDPRALARRWVLTGGEDHGLLATVPPEAVPDLPDGARVIGSVRAPRDGEGARLLIDGAEPGPGAGWDHFG
ncbi:thiamine-phosphate kinase [Actinomyces bowdenii]|uniref:Thiamine-monophosphate kinase n=1 Tax=Actinomyces bowdenii TaxID=131109 RepID=A0A3P1VAP9_9ACTO|nr:thiamine-phosphate kinase [Actinomyces bowdenii]RRD29663.1 thiamine-phosphate kinase [Actinomyces bowdenii]